SGRGGRHLRCGFFVSPLSRTRPSHSAFSLRRRCRNLRPSKNSIQRALHGSGCSRAATEKGGREARRGAQRPASERHRRRRRSSSSSSSVVVRSPSVAPVLPSAIRGRANT
ncbi:unnamed protein product, partial [Pylaiella littoralis]